MHGKTAKNRKKPENQPSAEAPQGSKGAYPNHYKPPEGNFLSANTYTHKPQTEFVNAKTRSRDQKRGIWGFWAGIYGQKHESTIKRVIYKSVSGQGMAHFCQCLENQKTYNNFSAESFRRFSLGPARRVFDPLPVCHIAVLTFLGS